VVLIERIDVALAELQRRYGKEQAAQYVLLVNRMGMDELKGHAGPDVSVFRGIPVYVCSTAPTYKDWGCLVHRDVYARFGEGSVHAT
jgi:hypothetical protein